MTNILSYSREFLYNCTCGLVVEPYQAGLKSLYKIYSISGFEKLSKVIQATCELAPIIFKELGNTLEPIAKVAGDQKDLLYASMSFDSICNFITFEEGKRIKFVRPTWAALPKILNGIGSFFETGRFLKKYIGIQFSSFSKWATQLEGFTVNGIQPFAYRPFKALCYNPKDFFIFTASVIEIIQHIDRFIRPVGNTPTEQKKARFKEISTSSLLGLAGHVGKLALIWFSGSHYHRTEYKILNFVTQNMSLLNFLIKAK